MNPFLYASHYAKRGVPVFPVHTIVNGRCSCGKLNCSSPGKHPKTLHGVKDATIDLNEIARWREKFGEANIGFCTGQASKIFVLDIDPRNGGFDSFVRLEEDFGELPETPVVDTGGGGFHYFFSCNGFPIRCGKLKNYPGIDIQASGKCIIAPPSRHISGKIYKWRDSFFDSEVPIALPPAWLIELIGSIAHAGSEIRADKTSWQDWLSEQNNSVVIQKGDRDEALTRIFGHLVSRRVDSRIAVPLIKSFNKTNIEPSLPQNDVIRIIESIYKRALSQEGWI